MTSKTQTQFITDLTLENWSASLPHLKESVKAELQKDGYIKKLRAAHEDSRLEYINRLLRSFWGVGASNLDSKLAEFTNLIREKNDLINSGLMYQLIENIVARKELNEFPNLQAIADLLERPQTSLDLKFRLASLIATRIRPISITEQ